MYVERKTSYMRSIATFARNANQRSHAEVRPVRLEHHDACLAGDAAQDDDDGVEALLLEAYSSSNARSRVRRV